MRNPDLRLLVHESRLLAGNSMGDPHVRRVPVYVPPGYDPGRSTPYPVIYLLAGWSGRGARYLNDEGVFTWRLQDRLDELILAGAMPPVLVVFPDGSSRLGCSQYVNSTVNGPYMDYVADELVDWIDGQFHTDRSRRGVMGHSSGGFGALVLGMLRPDRFHALMSSAGDSWYEYSFVEPIPSTLHCVREAGGVEAFVAEFLGSPNPFGLFSPARITAMLCLSMCPCYAPNPRVPVIKGDLYFDLETGALVPEVWEKFLAWDPVRMVDGHADALRGLRWIHLEGGLEDEMGLHLGHRQIARKLSSHGIRFAIDEYPGKHSGHHYRMPERIQRMLAALT